AMGVGGDGGGERSKGSGRDPSGADEAHGPAVDAPPGPAGHAVKPVLGHLPPDDAGDVPVARSLGNAVSVRVTAKTVSTASARPAPKNMLALESNLAGIALDDATEDTPPTAIPGELQFHVEDELAPGDEDSDAESATPAATPPASGSPASSAAAGPDGAP